ncbi:hypothetical protein CTA2_4735 [Colletotrichum tanaceti]|uniref:Uncharacterized protein n=1 Tax=Colletotrichum tanaceti TaxID=1306861 RepID=A0A4U6X6K2_9PEZI|nr:hypothetical protein CTA2_4735 [Colletotrichum tanaceti]TKW50925.1 hypothetical protein CTA1_1746 [Colletotrichum tanaceti]
MDEDFIVSVENNPAHRSSLSRTAKSLLDPILEYVWNTRQELGDKIRFFALGVGYRVPHRLINRIGRFGGGYGEVVDIEAKPHWEDRLMVMLAAGVGPNSWDCTIDLGPGFERRSLDSNRFWDESTQHESESPGVVSFVSFVQAPYPIPPMHPFAFRSIFLLLDLRSGSPPTKVILSANTTDEANPGTEHVLFLEPTKTDTSTIRHLATKAVLLGLKAEVDRQTPNRRQEELAQENAVALGTNYAVTSRWTSYVAVQHSTGVVDEVDFCKAPFLQGELADFIDTPISYNKTPRISHPDDPFLFPRLDLAPQQRSRHFPPRRQLVRLASIDWTDLVLAQESEGLLIINDSVRQTLSKHFHLGTADLLNSLVFDLSLLNIAPNKQQDFVDTIMINSYFQTHKSL